MARQYQGDQGLGSDWLDGVEARTVWRELRDAVNPTVRISSERLDRAVGSNIRIRLACESFQPTGSFKIRAAITVAVHAREPRLLAASSGNFGAALALAAARTGKGCTVVMPATSSSVKVSAVRSHGATVDLIDTDRLSRAARIHELAELDPQARVCSPYDDAWVIAGNSSLGRELLEHDPPDCIVAPVGGGGLASGLVLARELLARAVPIYGAEPAIANDASRSLAARKLLANDAEPATICDGARTLSLGKRNFRILSAGLAGIVEVAEETVVRAVRLLFEAANLKAEPTGALALAAVLERPALFAGRTVSCIVSGGNVDGALYARLIG